MVKWGVMRISKNFFWACLLAFAGVSTSRALESSELIRSGANAAFGRALFFKPPVVARLSVRQIKTKAPLSPKASQGLKTLRLSGYVHLQGSAFVTRTPSHVNVAVSGWTTLKDQEGRTLSGSINLSDSSLYFVSENHVSGWARPYAYVSIYDAGRHLGDARIEGSINVSGFSANNRLTLSGSGYVYGQLQVEDGASRQP